MSPTTGRKQGGSREVRQAFVERPFAGRWSAEEAAAARRTGLVIGPYVSNVDMSDPASVRAALADEPFGHLIPDEAIEKLCRDGHAADLFAHRYPTWRYGIDPITYPCFLLPPTVEELEAIEDKVHLAALIRDLDIRGTTRHLRALIHSTVEPERPWLGETVQDHLDLVVAGPLYY